MADRQHQVQNGFAHRGSVDAPAAGENDVTGQGLAAQEMIDAGRERLHPFQLRHAREQLVCDAHAERDQYLGLVILDVGIGGRLRDL